jgi:1-acyl-sn-glycerol-3-phosphate acyltransferase
MTTAKIIRWLIDLIIVLTCKIQVEGEDTIPDVGGCIIASNHLGRLDVFLVYKIIKRTDIIMGIAEKYQKYAIFRFIAKTLNATWIDRMGADYKALRQILRRLQDGGILVIAPEGTRSQHEALIAGKSGAAFLAAKAKVPVIPVALTGTEDRLVKQNLLKLKRSTIRIRVGDPFLIPTLKGGRSSEKLGYYTDEIMCQIASLLPDNYRGAYSKHPRLKELLSVK